jgi:hypothetical protein
MKYLIPFESEESACNKDKQIAENYFGGYTQSTYSIFEVTTYGMNIGLIIPVDEKYDYSIYFTRDEWNSRIIIEDEY